MPSMTSISSTGAAGFSSRKADSQPLETEFVEGPGHHPIGRPRRQFPVTGRGEDLIARNRCRSKT
jgi:hypothetical protein